MSLQIVSSPLSPWHLVTTAAGIIVVLVLSAGIARDLVTKQFQGTSWRHRLTVVLLSLIAAGCLTAAAWNLRLAGVQDPANAHLVVVLDVSDSVLRTEGGWPTVHKQVIEFLEKSLRRMPSEFRHDGRASIVTFRDNTTSDEVALDDLLNAVKGLEESRFASGRGSDIGAGLDRALQLLTRSDGRKAVLLISDGNDTHGEAENAAQEIARLGIPITVLPVQSSQPAISLTSINLPKQVTASEETVLRGVIWNQSEQEVQLAVEILQNTGMDYTNAGGFGLPMAASGTATSLPANHYGRLRQTLMFQGVGLQYVDVRLLREDKEMLHQRRFYTYVNSPIELLAIGGDNRWVGVTAPDVFKVTQITPEQIATHLDLSRFDAIVLSDIEASRFDAKELDRLAQTVKEKAVGLFVFNGGHRGADEQTESVLRSYYQTPIDELLPVSTEPRPFTPEPPPRQVVILVDSSGSMAGWPLAKAKEIASYIVRELLRPQDTLDVVGFTGGATQLVKHLPMTGENKQLALAQINSLRSGGGTDPTAALRLLVDQEMTNCGLVFISDGEFNDVTYRPDCRATVFAMQEYGLPGNSPLYELADPFVAGPRFSAAGVEIPYFEPEPRDKFFERGSYTPLSMAVTRSRDDLPPVPGLALEGTAVSYARPKAELIAVRPKFTDPVLAYGKAGEGYAGTFATELTSEWLDSAEGQMALEEWLKRVVPYAARDRYLFQVLDDGRVLSLQIALQSEDGYLPQVDQLTVRVEVGTETHGVTMVRDPEIPATFSGAIIVPRSEQAQMGRLMITESGVEALPRAQRVPILIPPIGSVDAASTTESNSFGLDAVLLRQIAELSGGEYAPEDGALFFQRALDRKTNVPLWPWLVLTGAASYLASIAVRRLAN